MSENIEFEVGHRYENMKGTYEVISINGDSMIIRWENGEEISTPIDLQYKIILRMKSEKQEREKIKAQPKSEKKTRHNLIGSPQYGAQFKGFKESDFKNNVTGTNWRSRNYLGGAVAQRLPSEEFNFNSWAVYRMPAVHWADIKHRGKDNVWVQAKFFAQVDEDYLYYGYYIERPDNTTKVKNDWSAFISWLRNEKNEAWLNKIVRDHDLAIYDPHEKCFSGIIRPHKEQWRINDNKIQGGSEIHSLNNFLDNLSEESWIDIQIAKRDSKDQVLIKADEIADDISKLFEILMPLYTASMGHSR